MVWFAQDDSYDVHGTRNNICTKRENTKGDKVGILSAYNFSTGELTLTFSKLAGDVSVGVVSERYLNVSDSSVVPTCWEYDVSKSCLFVKNNKASVSKQQAAVGTKIVVLLNIDQKTVEFSCNGVAQGKFALVGERFWAGAWMSRAESQCKLEIESLSDPFAQKPRDFLWTWASRRAHILRHKDLPLNFLIVGRFGVGKSSFFNALCTALQAPSDKRIREPLLVGHGTGLKNHGTTEFSVYRIPGTNFQIYDLWGSDGTNFTRGELAILARGCMLPGFKKEPNGNENTTKFTRPGEHGPIEHWPHAVLLAVDGKGSKGGVSVIKAFTHTVMTNFTAADPGFHDIVVLLSRVDETLDPELRKHPERVYSSPHIRAALKSLQKDLGVPPSVIFPVKNYHAERERNFFLEALVLDAFAASVDQAVSFFRGLLKRNPPLPTQIPQAEQAAWRPVEAPLSLPMPVVATADEKELKAQLGLEDTARLQESELEHVGPTAAETKIGDEVDDFVWSKYQKEADSLCLFLRSLGIPAQDAKNKARIGVTMASGDLKTALRFAFSNEYFE